jgi:imidazole glycerol-phosphate synthase subunit HisH
VVPGVGHFAATAALDAGWREAVRDALDRGALLFGICLGQQWLYEGSDEAPDAPGLGLIAGRCRRLPPTLKVPHVGWNALEIVRPSRLLEGVPGGTQTYFTHSYAADITPETVATTTHAAPFASVVETTQVFGVQFHPEKSGPSGVRMLRNFVTLCSRSA